ncbi:MAG: alanine racemase [Gammaproteobacteria bacterium]|nr:alanine racemase [Gammaproteobacteria bacterium]
MSRPAQITIDITALKHNFAKIRMLARQSRIIAMVKANAYGHGLLRIASALPETDAFGVACIEEGMQLRALGIQNPIILMEGLFTSDELQLAIENHFSIVVHHPEQINMLEAYKKNNTISVWLKINTGMNRLGFKPKYVLTAWQRLMHCAHVKKPIGLMTHFAESDLIHSAKTVQQMALFESTTADLSGPRSLANSGAILTNPATHADWIRPGMILYGGSPFADKTGLEFDLRPVMSLTSRLIAINDVSRGARVGYGGTWTCPEDTRIGVVAMGYGDGYPRHARNGTPVLVNQKICPLVGRVSMDMLTVDLNTQPDARVGDPVVLWGEGLPAEHVAANSETTNYELLTHITQRVPIIEKKLSDHYSSVEKKADALI